MQDEAKERSRENAKKHEEQKYNVFQLDSIGLVLNRPTTLKGTHITCTRAITSILQCIHITCIRTLTSIALNRAHVQ